MGRLITLMMLLILGTVAVRTQEPNPYMTNGKLNGLYWMRMSYDVKVGYALGADNANISTSSALIFALRDDPPCQSTLVTANKAREKSYTTYTHGDILREMDAFYSVGANISLPTEIALTYVHRKLAGATKAELDSYLTTVK